MRKKTRYLLLLIVLGSLGSIAYGFLQMEQAPVLANRCIGFGVVGLFLLAMPIFLVTESRGKKMRDYMLTDENIRKMRERREENK